ncbi:MAG: DinB family protein [Terracidiphilus sp.]|jgi:DinB family protein
MEFNLQDSIVLLACTPSTLNALLRDLPDTWTNANEGENTWTPNAVIAHLIHGEQSDWMVRARIILHHGDTQTFQPVDRSAHLQMATERSLSELLDGFKRLRSMNLEELNSLHIGPHDLKLRGRHPALGAVTLSELFAAWTVHDLTHLHQITRILAHQYHEAVGPWNKFLGVLQCSGHSAPA